LWRLLLQLFLLSLFTFVAGAGVGSKAVADGEALLIIAKAGLKYSYQLFSVTLSGLVQLFME